MKSIFQNERLDKMARLYRDGMTMRQLAKKYDTTSTTISRVFKRAGISARAATRIAAECNTATFDIVTEESAYWAGFLMADGNIGLGRRGGGQQSVNLSLAEIDEPHIQKFKAFVDSKSPVLKQIAYLRTTGKEYVAYKIQIHSDDLANSLARYGVVPQKTKIARVLLLEADRHFWRGYIDGNGSIVFPTDRTPFLACSAGSRELMQQFSTYIAMVDANESPLVKLGHGSWDLRIHGARAAYFATHLYKDATVSLDRKREKAERLMQYTTTSTQYFKPPPIQCPATM